MSKTVHKSLINVSGATLLTVVFVLLKAFGKIDWSWWWVFTPIWGPLAIILAVCLGTLLVIAVVALVHLIFGR